MEMLHLLNSTGLILSAVVVLMMLMGEVGLAISAFQADKKPQQG
mgnify:CR=1 FL=1